MRIAVVDPSRTVLKIVTQLLEARGHSVRTFTDGREALDQITSDLDVDALITSMELASMSGVELCRQVRALATNGRPIYVVLMSSNYDRSKLIEALGSGADDFISKPPAIEELYARLRAAERLGEMQRKLYEAGDDRPADRRAEPARVLREGGRSLQAHRERRRPVGDHVRHRPFQTHQRRTWP